MVAPFHQYASVPLLASPAAAHERLMANPADLIAAATATALSLLEPLIRSWGLSPIALPSLTTTPTEPDTIGSVEVRWSGDEDKTGWPSLLARLLVVPACPNTGARIVLLSPRSPGAELATNRLGRLYRRRIVSVATQRFLHDLAARLADSDHHSGAFIGPGVTSFDRRPLFLHHVQAVSVDPAELVSRLTDDPWRLAVVAATVALEAAAEPLAAGRFRSSATPQVSVEAPTAGQLGVLRLNWASDEEATGWPRISLVLVVEAASAGSRLAVLSSREPGYDMSVNRIDKRQRDLVIRHLGSHVGDAILHSLVPPIPTRDSGLMAHSVGRS